MDRTHLIIAPKGLPPGTQLPTEDGWIRLGEEVHPGQYRLLAYCLLPPPTPED